ncbi:MAG: peptidylprolyl isomerase [Planctomycetota bacterium]
MSQLLRTVVVPLLALAAFLPAQEGEKAKPAESKPAKEQPQGDDALTANDVAIKAIDKFIADSKIDKAKSGWKTSLSKPPNLPFDANADYFWHMETEFGPIKLRYFPEASPAHVSSGIYLARLGFYDGLTFHRVMPQFMAQGGDPAGNGQGGPGYRIDAEFKNGLKHSKAGILSMARTPDPNSAGSQFFITFKDTPPLDDSPARPGYTVWGEVVAGMEAVRELEKRGTNENNGMLKTPIKILKTWVSVAAKAKAAEKPKAEPPKEEKKEPGC